MIVLSDIVSDSQLLQSELRLGQVQGRGGVEGNRVNSVSIVF